MFVTEKINVTTDHLMPSEWTSKWPHLRDIELPSLPDHTKVELIIGLKSSINRIILDQRHGEEDEPSAYLTRIGWVVCGPTGSPVGTSPAPVHHVHVVDETTEVLQKNFNRDFWEKRACSVTEDSI